MSLSTKPAGRSDRGRFVWFVLLGMLAAFISAVLLVNFILLPWHVHLGREAVVPVLIGMDRDQAEQELKKCGFALGDVRLVPDTHYSYGKVVDTRPRGGSRVKVGRAVALELSSGQEKTLVPQVYRLSARRAQAAIENAGLRVGEIQTATSVRVPEGEVISSDPPAGLRVAKGTVVKLVVSIGSPGLAEMPRLKGLQIERARDIVINCGLVLLPPAEVPSPEPAGTVLTQVPAEGTEVQLGDTVRVTVAKPSPTSPPAKTKKETPKEVKRTDKSSVPPSPGQKAPRRGKGR